MVIAHHLVLTGYAHWLPNDPRGSGSTELREEKLSDLGEIHFGRKCGQPPREELRKFWRDSEPLLDHKLLWFTREHRNAIASTIASVVRDRGYTLWALAILQNHAHACVRMHRDSAEKMWTNFADASREVLHTFDDVPIDHPIWSLRPYKVFKDTPEAVVKCIDYIESNPRKSGLSRQVYDFVQPYDGWTPGGYRRPR